MKKLSRVVETKRLPELRASPFIDRWSAGDSGSRTLGPLQKSAPVDRDPATRIVFRSRPTSCLHVVEHFPHNRSMASLERRSNLRPTCIEGSPSWRLFYPNFMFLFLNNGIEQLRGEVRSQDVPVFARHPCGRGFERTIV